MKRIISLVAAGLLVLLAGCATPGGDGPTNPYRGTYSGVETLEGGTTVPAGDYPLKIYISDQGRIRIVDVDGITAYGTLENNWFRVVRPSPKQIFEGKVEDALITGITTANRFTGDGTFRLERVDQ